MTRRRGYKRAIVATAHKLLRCVFAILRRTPYRDPATDYEALLVHRNAPRWLRKLHQFDILVPNQDGTYAVHWPVVPQQEYRPDDTQSSRGPVAARRRRGHLGQPRSSDLTPPPPRPCPTPARDGLPVAQ